MARRLHTPCIALAGLLRAFAVPAVMLGIPPSAAAVLAPAAAVHPYAAPVVEASQRFDIPEEWIWRVMHAESRGNRRAVSHARAMGLMQIMPATWRMLTARHRLGEDPFDARANIHAGAAYLRAMWDRYRDVGLMLAAYNAGPGRADAYASGRRGLPAETIAYVAKIAPELGAAPPHRPTSATPAAALAWRDADLFSAREETHENMEIAPAEPPTRPAEQVVRPRDAGRDRIFVPLSGYPR